MTVPPVQGFLQGLRNTRQAQGDGTLQGRVRSAMPASSRPVGGRQEAISRSAGPSVRVDTLTLTANSQAIAATSDDVTWHNELVGLTPREGFGDYGGTPTDTITMPADGRLLTTLTLMRSTATAWTIRWHITRGSKTLTYDMAAGSSTDPAIAEAPPLTVKSGDVLRVRILQSSGGSETLDSATIHLTLLNVSPRSEAPTVALTQRGSLGVLDPRDVAVTGNYAFVISNGNNRLYVVDISDPDAPTHAGQVTDSTNMAAPFGVDAAGNYVYVASFLSDSLAVIDVSDPTAPAVVGVVSTPELDQAKYVAVNGNYAYVTAAGIDAFVVVDISTPTAPTQVGFIDLGTSLSPAGVAVQYPYCYVVEEFADKLHVIDVSTPASPTEVGTLTGSFDHPHGVVVDGNYAYISSHNSDSLTIVDISTPTAPVQVGHLTSPLIDRGYWVAVSGDFAFVTAELSDTLVVVDVSDKTAPTIVDSFTSATDLNAPYGLTVVGEFVYVAANASDALAIFSYS